MAHPLGYLTAEPAPNTALSSLVARLRHQATGRCGWEFWVPEPARSSLVATGTYCPNRATVLAVGVDWEGETSDVLFCDEHAAAEAEAAPEEFDEFVIVPIAGPAVVIDAATGDKPTGRQ